MTPRAGSDVARLTDRQYEVLRLLAAGLSNAGIGDRLGITEKSVQNHVNGMYATLGIDSDPNATHGSARRCGSSSRPVPPPDPRRRRAP